MKIGKVLNLINENIVIDFGHFHFDSTASFLNRYCSEDEEFEPDTWGEETLEKCKNDKDFVEYDEAKELYDKLSRKEQNFVSPNGNYKNSPKLVFRLGERDKGDLIGFIDVYYFPKEKKSSSDVDKLIDDISSSKSFDGRDGFITMAVDPKYRGKGIAKKLLAAAAKKAKNVGLDALTYEVEYKNKPSIYFIQKFSSKFKNETPAPKGDTDSGTLIFRYRFEKEEDEITSAILSTAPQGGALNCGDNYAPGDMRVPKLLGKIQRRKKEEDAEQPVPPTLYRYMSLEEMSELLSYGAFTRLLDFDEDCDGKVKNPAGNMPFFKSFTYKLTKAGLEEFMGPGHVICAFNTAAFPKNPLLPYTYDDGFGATHEYEYRLFAKSKKVPCDVTNLIKAVIFCKASEGVDNDEVENLLLDLNDSGINAEVFYVDNPLRKASKKIVFELDENDELVSRKA